VNERAREIDKQTVNERKRGGGKSEIENMIEQEYERTKRERETERERERMPPGPVRATSWTCECRLIGAWSVRVLTHESWDRWRWRRRGRGVEAPTGGGGGGGSVRVCFQPP